MTDLEVETLHVAGTSASKASCAFLGKINAKFVILALYVDDGFIAIKRIEDILLNYLQNLIWNSSLRRKLVVRMVIHFPIKKQLNDWIRQLSVFRVTQFDWNNS